MPKDASSPDCRPSRAGPYRSSRATRVSRVQPDDHATGSDNGSFFQSSSNVDIRGGNFSIARGHHTNLTINVNQVGQDDIESEGRRQPVHRRWNNEMDACGEDIEICRVNEGRSEETWRRTPALPVQKSCDIYYRHLAVKGRGSPLWIPEPNNELPVAYRRRGIFIGDVGIITASGSFDFLFNICVPPDDPINPENLPEDFFPLDPPLRPIDLRGQSEFMPNSYLASASIQRLQYDGTPSGLIFECSASEGAILTMPDGAYSRDLANVARFRKYLAANVERWYRYINGDLGREAKNGDVRLVIGCDKTSTWGMATFSNLTEHPDLQLKFRPTGESAVGPTYGWEYSGMAEVRVGPSHQEIAELEVQDEDRATGYRHLNQCLFVRTLNASLRDDVWDRLSSEFDTEAAYIPDSLNVDFRHPSSTSSAPRSQISRDSSPFYSGNTSGTHYASKFGNVKSLKKKAQRIQTSNLTTGLTAHPSNEINAMILEMFNRKFPDARMVVTEDADWISGLREGDSTLPRTSNLLARVLKSNVLEVCEDEGVICFREKYPMHIASTNSVTGRKAYAEARKSPTQHRGEQQQTGSSNQKICLGCNDTSSGKWHTGPMGPKTLCADCGRAYAKIMRVQSIEAQDRYSPDHELEEEVSSSRGLDAKRKARQRSPFES